VVAASSSAADRAGSPMFAELVATARFSSLMRPPVDERLADGLALQIERLAHVAEVLADRPTPYIGRAQVLRTAAERAHTVARILPELRSGEVARWARAEAASALEMIELCRDDVAFPPVLDDLMYDVRIRVDALVDDRLHAA